MTRRRAERTRLAVRRFKETSRGTTFNEPLAGGKGKEDPSAWTQIAFGRGTYQDLSGRELEQARQIIADATVRVTWRRPPRWLIVTTEDRIELLDHNRTLGVYHITTDERRRDIILLCGEQAS